jgi:aspartyl/asparaginyl-tRNA synthetase
MIYWTIKTVTISIIFIFLIHHLIEFFKNTLTVPKVKDLVNIPTQKYENIFNILSKKNYENNNITNNMNDDIEKINSNLSTNINKLPVVADDMKSELKKFLKQQMTNNTYNS